MKLSKILLFSVIPLFTAGVMFLISLIILTNSSIKMWSTNIRNDGGYYLTIQQESDPLAAGMEQYQELFSSLKNDALYTYYELYRQSLDFPDASNDGWSACVQISENVQEDFQLSVAEGRLLEPSDFVYDGKRSLPVLMGNDYRSQYELGDVFQANYLFDEYTFTVVGFLTPGSAIRTSLKSTLLDEAIVMPSFDVEAAVPVTDSLLFHYANKTSGMIKMAVEDEAAVLRYIVPILENASTGEYSWSSSNVSAAFRECFGVEASTARLLFCVLAGCLAVASALCLFKWKRDLWECGSVKLVLLRLLPCVAAADILYFLLACATPVWLGISFRFFIFNGFPIVLIVNLMLIAAGLVRQRSSEV